MRSVLTVSVPATVTKLVTRERVKSELDISDNASDYIIAAKIDEASSDIEAVLGYRLPRETVVETFWFEGDDQVPEFLLLNRIPVASITSVVVDDVAIDSSLYRLDAAAGQLYALDSSGYPFAWLFCKSIVVTCVAGYLLPGQASRDLPAGIEGAALELVSDFWSARGRDPSVKAEDIPGVISTQYWVGAVGEEGQLPPRVMMKLAPHRRPSA